MLTTVSPLRGWMLDLSVALDAHQPGFAGSYLRASNERRQVIAAYCAQQVHEGTPLREVGEFLSGARHKTILQRAFGDVPPGLRGSLAKAGAQPHDRRFYWSLYRFLSAPRHPRLATTVRQMPLLDFPRLRILNILPEEVCAPNVVEAIGEVSTAKDVARLIDLLIENGVDRRALNKAITSVSDAKQLTKLWDRWAGRCRLPESPVKPSAGYRPVETADDLRRLARRYRNCAARYLPEALEGSSAFGEILPGAGQPGMVVHLRNRPQGWEIDGLFLKHNGRPNSVQREHAEDFLHAAGVKRREKVGGPEGEWSSLRRLTSTPFWGFDED